MLALDWIVLGLFFLGLIGIIVWVLMQKEETTTDYFLAGKNAGRRGAILAGYFKLLPVLIFLIPGMVAYALNQKGLLAIESSDSAFAAMVTQLLPAGVTGVVVCGLLAALMSSLVSLFNSSSMLFVDMKSAATAWIYSGGVHHSGFSQALTAEHMSDFAIISGIEFILIDENCMVENLKKELRWNDLYYHINKALC